MSRNSLDYRLETLSGEPLKTKNLGIDNTVINFDSEIKNEIEDLEKNISINDNSFLYL